MSEDLVIRNLDPSAMRRLQILADRNCRSMEDEAVVILSKALVCPETSESSSNGKFDPLIGIWKSRMSTDEIMLLTRGE
jgi:plasmid stability protein